MGRLRMYKYFQKILEKVSFDRELFTKELRKAINILDRKELLSFRVWCLATFGHLYQDVIIDAFNAVGETIKTVS